MDKTASGHYHLLTSLRLDKKIQIFIPSAEPLRHFGLDPKDKDAGLWTNIYNPADFKIENLILKRSAASNLFKNENGLAKTEIFESYQGEVFSTSALCPDAWGKG